jgi:alpha-galactosidase
LLHGGEVVRADDEPSGLFVHGVVADDRAAALYAVVRLASAAEASPGPFRLPGLDESWDYRVRVRGEFFAPDRGRPPPWWNAAATDGFTVSGALLGRTGLQLPVLMPGQGFLLHGTAEHSEA